LTDLIKNEKVLTVRIAAARGLGQMGSGAKEALPTLRQVASMARAAGKSQRRLAQAAREAIQAIQGQRKKK
jgi:hypothetical protein